jgi:hypothetical protein
MPISELATTGTFPVRSLFDDRSGISEAGVFRVKNGGGLRSIEAWFSMGFKGDGCH